jgi:tRNA nucleotidyltransferase (CCA-adding enzyme)
MKFTDKQLELFKKVQEMFKETPVYLVGGAVRDFIKGDIPKDYDFCTILNPDNIEYVVKQSGRRAYLTGKRFGTIGCKIDGEMIEITTFRSEEYVDGSRKPEVKFVDNITEDLSRRDFTINAMAIRLDTLKLIDPFGGQEDLILGIIKCVGNSKQRFKEDPLRILRAIRFAARYGFGFEKMTERRIEHMAVELLKVSKERWVMELDKILMSDYVIDGLDYLWEKKIFNYIIPELSLQCKYKQNSSYHNWDLEYHTELVIERCPMDLELRWAALLHDVAKPFCRTDKETDLCKCGHDRNFHDCLSDGCCHDMECKGCKGWDNKKSNYIGHEILGAEMAEKICKYLKFSNERTNRVVDLVRNHLNDDCELRQYDNQAKKGDMI